MTPFTRRAFLVAAQFVPNQSDRPEAAVGNEPGFRSMFDGKTLDGWEGDPNYRRVDGGDGCQEQHVFDLARWRSVKDTVTPSNRFAMRGYQRYRRCAALYRNNYEEKRRLFLAERRSRESRGRVNLRSD